LTFLSPFLFYSFLLICCINLGYFLYFSVFNAEEQKENGSLQNDGISVIICAKNEAAQLPALIEKLLLQDFPLFEIIMINDHSSDASLGIMQDFEKRNANISVFDLKSTTGKKAGITLGIKNAQYETLVFTDADCLPASNQWLKKMSAAFSRETQIVLGYGAYKKFKGSVLNKLIRFETLLTALQYCSYALRKNPYMGVGRNLAYSKSLFNTSGGFEAHNHVKPGDDDLFVNQNATPTNVAVCTKPEAFTISAPKTNWRDWFIQKRRHVGVAHLYLPKHQLQLGMFYTSQLLFFILFALVLVTQGYLLPAVGLFFTRELYVWRVYAKAAKKLKEQDLIFYSLLLEPFLVSLQLLIFITNTLVKPRRWK